MSHQFKGIVEIQNDENASTISLDGDHANITAGGEGQDGDIVIRDSQGKQTITIRGMWGEMRLGKELPGGERIDLDGKSGNIAVFHNVDDVNRLVMTFNAHTADFRVGAVGIGGDINVEDEDGRTVIRLMSRYARLFLGANGRGGQIIIRDQNGRNAIGIIGDAAYLQLGATGNPGTIYVQDGEGRNVLTYDGTHSWLQVGAKGNYGNVFVKDGDGRRVIHLNGQSAALHIGTKENAGTLNISDNNARNAFHFAGSTARLSIGTVDNGGNIFVQDEVGRNVFRFTHHTATLSVGANGNEGNIWVRDGNGRIVARFDGNAGRLSIGTAGNGGNVVVKNDAGNESIRLDGNTGDIRLSNADAAEQFDIAESVETAPGTVMVLNHEGKLEPSSVPYDRKVVGVVAGAGSHHPGIVLDHKVGAITRVPISVMGKVSCRVNADYSPIEVGDLLTTSPTLGHAMKAIDSERAFGSVIGKAISPILKGLGQIDMLIALQ